MRIYITGLNSYLGGWLLPMLEEAGHHVIGYDSHGQLIYKHIAIRKSEESIEECHAVIPLAWYASVNNKTDDLQKQSLEKLEGLVKYLAHNSMGHIHVVFPSTAAVYGDSGSELIHEDCQKHPVESYGAAKLSAERAIERNLEGRYTIFRFGSLMGVGMKGERTKRQLVVNAFAIDGYRKKVIEVWNHLDWKPVLHVKDAARLIVEAVQCNKLYAGTFNACYTSHRAETIARIASRITGAMVKIAHNEQAGRRSCKMDNYELTQVCNWVGSFSTIEQAISEFQNYVETPNDSNTLWVDRSAHTEGLNTGRDGSIRK